MSEANVEQSNLHSVPITPKSSSGKDPNSDPDREPERNSSVDENQLPTEAELAAKAKKLESTFFGGLFPILKEERKRFWLLNAIFFLTVAVYSFLRLYKDSVLHSVLEPAAQNWLKLFTFLASLVLVGAVQMLLDKNSIDTVFEYATLGFAFTLAAMSVLITYRSKIQLRAGFIEEFFVSGSAQIRGLNALYTLMLIFNHWVLSLFYIICEVISSIMVSFLFLTYSNSHCTADQNKRFVRVFYIFANVAGFSFSKIYQMWNDSMKPKNVSEREKYYFIFTLSAVGIFCLIFLLKRALDKEFKRNIVISSGRTAPVTNKQSLSLAVCLYYAFASILLIMICIIFLAYNICANLSSSLLSNACAAAAVVLNQEKQGFAGHYKSLEMQCATALVIVVLLSPVSKFSEYFGILAAGTIPILVSLIGGFIVCLLAIVNYPALGEDNMKFVNWLSNIIPKNPLLEVRANVAVSAAVKISKYAFFDIVKESISMKINPAIRPLFKGVFDGVCGKLGKCAGSIYGIVMEACTGKRDARYNAPITFIIIALISIGWFYAMIYLHKSYKTATEKGTYMSPDFIDGFKGKE